jgi:hypothetical protein
MGNKLEQTKQKPFCFRVFRVTKKGTRKMKPHKHAELIKAWADGATIEAKALGQWMELERNFVWHEDLEYRIKPEPKPDVVLYSIVHRVSYGLPCSPYASMSSAYAQPPDPQTPANLKLTFDGETGELKSAEVVK